MSADSAETNTSRPGVVRRAAHRVLRHDEVDRLHERVTELEAQIDELRQHHLRLAELADVMQELLVPLASRDEARVDAALESFPKSL